MKSIKTIEDRIVTLQKVTADGVESVVEAELKLQLYSHVTLECP